MTYKPVCLLLFFVLSAHCMLIYRPKQHRPKLVCYAVPSDGHKQTEKPVTDSTVVLDGEEQAVRAKIVDSPPFNDIQMTQRVLSGMRVRRNTQDFDELNFNNGFDIDIVGATLTGKDQDKIRKKLIRTCEALAQHNIY
ncbi:hypothetical protein M3Y97_01038600 [Aphelenchoides bicaudatus]|nr:hypothetical protein M3Y97_01038600 [Aphelenchoides bicaudatus]